MADDERSILDSNSLRLNIGGRDTKKHSLIVSDFQFQVSQDKPLQHGISNENPQGRIHGNREITLNFTLTGEDADLFQKFADEQGIKSTDMTVVAYGDEVNWEIRHLDHTNLDYSVSDGEGVEFAVDMNALDIVQV